MKVIKTMREWRGMKMILIFLSLMNLALAQHQEQPQKESSSDLRAHFILLSVEMPESKKIYTLERTAAQDYFLRLRHKKEEKILKVTSRDALKLDKDFASRFLKCQYEFEPQNGDCDVTLRLSMKGEKQNICEKEEGKARELQPFLSELAKRF
jgi:hypothetical protein